MFRVESSDDQKKVNDLAENGTLEYTLHSISRMLITLCLLLTHFEEALAEGPHLPLARTESVQFGDCDIALKSHCNPRVACWQLVVF